MENIEHKIQYTPDVNTTFPTSFEPRSVHFHNWELTRADGRTCFEVEVSIYKGAEGKPVEIPEQVTAAALLRIRDSFLNKEWFMCLSADDQELLAFDNELTMAKLREFFASDEVLLYVCVGHLVYDVPHDEAVEPIASLGYFGAVRKEYLEIALLDATTNQVIKPIYGIEVPQALDSAI